MSTTRESPIAYPFSTRLADLCTAPDSQTKEIAAEILSECAKLYNASVALAEYDATLEQAISELVRKGDKDFFWENRVADFVSVARSLRRKYRRLIA